MYMIMIIAMILTYDSNHMYTCTHICNYINAYLTYIHISPCGVGLLEKGAEGLVLLLEVPLRQKALLLRLPKDCHLSRGRLLELADGCSVAFVPTDVHLCDIWCVIFCLKKRP